MIALLLALLCGTANALEVKAPSPNSGTITPTAITAVTGSFSGSVTASSVTSLGDMMVPTNGKYGGNTAAAGGYNWIKPYSDTNSAAMVFNTGFGGANGGYMWLVADAQKMFLSGDGFLGIGTASPCSTCTLHVAGGASVTGGLGLGTRTKAQFDAANGVLQQAWLCSDCAIPYSLCVGTGTTLSGWKVSHSATIGCGTNN